MIDSSDFHVSSPVALAPRVSHATAHFRPRLAIPAKGSRDLISASCQGDGGNFLEGTGLGRIDETGAVPKSLSNTSRDCPVNPR